MGIGIVLKSLTGITITQLVKFDFKVTNHQYEHESLLPNVGSTQGSRASNFVAYFDLLVVVRQVNEDYKVRDESLLKYLFKAMFKITLLGIEVLLFVR